MRFVLATCVLGAVVFCVSQSRPKVEVKKPLPVRQNAHRGSKCSLIDSSRGQGEAARHLSQPNGAWIQNLHFWNIQVYSQNGEDGIILYIFQNIGVTDRFFVEFGTEDGSQINTRYLRERCGWTGALMDGGFSNPSINLTQAFITPSNIVELFEHRRIPKEFDLLSIDVDSTDLWIWRNLTLLHGYRPRVLVIEMNPNYAIDEYWTFPNDANVRWASSSLGVRAPADCLMGASLAALNLLAEQSGYSLVAVDAHSVNAFFVRDDVLAATGSAPPSLSVLHPPPKPVHQPCSLERLALRVDYKVWSNQFG